jgi:hypothetical protein
MKSISAFLAIPAATFILAGTAYAEGGGGLIEIDIDIIDSFIEAMRTLLFALLAALA